MERFCKSRRIQTSPRLNLESDWIPHAHITCNDQGVERLQLLVGPPDRFKIIDHAEIHAVEMAIVWIDAELLEELTP